MKKRRTRSDQRLVSIFTVQHAIADEWLECRRCMDEVAKVLSDEEKIAQEREWRLLVKMRDRLLGRLGIELTRDQARL